MKLKTKTPIYVFTGISGNDILYISNEKLEALNGRVYEDEVFTDYLNEPFYSMGISGGKMVLEYEKGGNEIFSVSVFEFPKDISQKEIDDFIEDINGQISDGMGSNFFQELSEEIQAEIEMADAFDNHKKTTYEIML